MRKLVTTLASTVGAAALLILAPIASAEPPAACAPDDQQCQDQQRQQEAAAAANQAVDKVQQGVDQAQKTLQPPTDRRGGPAIMVSRNGVPYCMPVANPGLQLGDVVTSLTGDGTSQYC